MRKFIPLILFLAACAPAAPPVAPKPEPVTHQVCISGSNKAICIRTTSVEGGKRVEVVTVPIGR